MNFLKFLDLTDNISLNNFHTSVPQNLDGIYKVNVHKKQPQSFRE